MTNEEAIKCIEINRDRVYDKIRANMSLSDGFLPLTYRDAKLFLEASSKMVIILEENTKLKSEIEELNKRLDVKETLLILQETTMSMLSSDKDTFIHKYQNAKAEIEQLKSELEQSVKLPCKVGDTIYTTNWIRNKVFSNVVTGFEVYKDDIYIATYDSHKISMKNIGLHLFLSREEAEQSLKGVTND